MEISNCHLKGWRKNSPRKRCLCLNWSLCNSVHLCTRVCLCVRKASVGLLVSPRGAGAHVNEGSCWTGLLLLPPFSFLLPPSTCPSPGPLLSLSSVPFSDGGAAAKKPTSPLGTLRTHVKSAVATSVSSSPHFSNRCL